MPMQKFNGIAIALINLEIISYNTKPPNNLQPNPRPKSIDRTALWDP